MSRPTSRVLLIYPPNQLLPVETPRPDGSLGPLYLAASLEAHGIPTDILDASVGPSGQSLETTFCRSVLQENGLIRIGMSFSEIAEFVIQGGYRTVGISSNFTPQTRMVIETARAIKKANPAIQVYTGGVNARALRETFLRTGLFDGICLGEGELILPRMIAAHARGESVLTVPGVAANEHGVMKVNPIDASCFPASLDDLPMPAWEKLPLEQYARIASPHGVDVSERHNQRYAPIMTSRGCPFQCAYCHISQEKNESDLTGAIGKLRLHSIDRVMREIDVLVSLGVGALFFEDDSMLAAKPRVKQIFSAIKKHGLRLANVNGVNLVHLFKPHSLAKPGQWEIDEDYLHVLKEGGFDQMVFPVESGSQRILDTYATAKVKLDRMDLPKLMRLMTDLGIKAPVNMMIGFPDETEAEIRQSIDLAKKLMDAGAPYVTLFIPIPFPGSRLFDIALTGGWLDANFDPDLMNWKNPVMKNTVVGPQRLVELRDQWNAALNTESHQAMRLKQSAGHRLAMDKEGA
jgi:radical SAM superfamily enzyme YgiQ (UPF0313 family)